MRLENWDSYDECADYCALTGSARARRGWRNLASLTFAPVLGPCIGRLGLLVFLGVVATLSGSVAARSAETPPKLTVADFVLSDAAEPPGPDAAWQQRLLPDAWVGSRPQWRFSGVHAGFPQNSGWYRLRFDIADKPEQPYAAYIPEVSPTAALYVNRSYIGRTGLIDRAPNISHPQYFVIPPGVLRVGANELFVRIAGEGMHGLTAITVGEDSEVRPEYERRVFWQVSGPQFCAAFAALWGVFAMLMWLRRRDDAIYAYFGLAGICWAIYTTVGEIVQYPPTPQPLWFALLAAAATGKIIFMALFALRYAGLRLPRVERLLLSYCVLLIGVQWSSHLLGIDAWLADNRRWFMLSIVFGYVAVFIFAAWRQPSLESLLVAIAGSVHFVNWFYQKAFPHPYGSLQLYAYDVLPMILVLGWILVDRFVKALKAAETLNAELEHRVAQKHSELELNYRQLRHLERQHAIAEERKRIMSDMHDGIGGQLISTLSLVEQHELSPKDVATALRECIEDLRLTIDSLEPTDNDLLTVLGNLRYRVDGRLEKCGINLDWQVRDVPKLACLTPQNVLHILRILQEAFTNVLKHAGANSVSVETGVDAPGEYAYIRVHDNGKGFSGDRVGHGLANMRQRARTIGGRLDIEPSPTGTTLRLLLPVG